MKTPTSVMVLAIIGIVLGALGILGAIGGACFLFVPFGPPNPMLDMLREDKPYVWFVILSGSVSLVLETFKIVACSASIKLKPWSRQGMIVYACIAIVHVIVANAFNFAYVVPKMASVMHGPAATGANIGGIVGGIFGLLFGLAYPICVLYFFTRPNIIDAFNGVFHAPPSHFPVQPPSTQDPNTPFP